MRIEDKIYLAIILGVAAIVTSTMAITLRGF